MKRKYNAPEMNLIKLETTDIMSASTEEFDGECVPIGGRSSENELAY